MPTSTEAVRARFECRSWLGRAAEMGARKRICGQGSGGPSWVWDPSSSCPASSPIRRRRRDSSYIRAWGAARGRSRWDGAPRVGNGLSQLSRTRASVYVPPSGCRMGRPSFSAVLSRSWRCSSRAPVKSSAWTRPLWGRAPTTANGSSGRNPCKANSSGFEAGLRTAEAFAPSCPRSMDEAFWSPSAGTASPASWVEASTRAGRPTTSGPSPVRRGAALGWGRCSGRA